MDEQVFDKQGISQIFTSDEELETIIWYLLYLLGGKVVIPTEGKFWIENVPDGPDRRIILRKENGDLVLVAESVSWK